MSKQGTSHLNQYRAFLVRLSKEAAQTDWRISARDIQSSQLMRFDSLADLLAFLDEEMTDHDKFAEAESAD